MCVLVHLSCRRIPYERLNGLILGSPISYDIKGRDNGLKVLIFVNFVENGYSLIPDIRKLVKSFRKTNLTTTAAVFMQGTPMGMNF